jgi:hypothetical protein
MILEVIPGAPQTLHHESQLFSSSGGWRVHPEA